MNVIKVRVGTKYLSGICKSNMMMPGKDVVEADNLNLTRY